VEQQLGLFEGSRGPSPVSKGPRPRVRRHRPRAGELGVALASPQADIVDRVLEDLAGEDAMRGHALPVRVEDVLYLPRDLDVVGALIDRHRRAQEIIANLGKADIQMLHQGVG